MMVKRKIQISLFFLALCSLSILPACTFHGPHKPVGASGGQGKPGGDGGGGVAGGPVTYDDVKPIFEVRCATCHLRDHKWTLDQATAESKKATIKTRVGDEKSMPFPGSDQAKSMTDDERAKIVAWATGESLGGQSPVTEAAPAKKIKSDTNPHELFVQRCQGCHGEKGTNPEATIPNLTGHSPEYILKRLSYFLKPEAVGTLMPDQIKALVKEFGLNDESDPTTMEFFNYVAKYFSEAEPQVHGADKQAERAKLNSDQLAKYQKGLDVLKANACVSCHLGNEGKPIAGAPMIFNQKNAYILSRFKDFADEKMSKITGDETMPSVISGLSAEELDAVAYYLSLTAPDEAPVGN